jgi:hypothetical protein
MIPLKVCGGRPRTSGWNNRGVVWQRRRKVEGRENLGSWTYGTASRLMSSAMFAMSAMSNGDKIIKSTLIVIALPLVDSKDKRARRSVVFFFLPQRSFARQGNGFSLSSQRARAHGHGVFVPGLSHSYSLSLSLSLSYLGIFFRACFHTVPLL